jgi:hypothetical protein
MKNILYSKTVVDARDSEDGEMPTRIILTQEENCFALWVTGFRGTHMLRYFLGRSRDEAIEAGVDEARNWINQEKEFSDTPSPDGVAAPAPKPSAASSLS